MFISYILILTMAYGGSQSGAAITMQEFNSERSCMVAANFWLENIKAWNYKASAICVAKGV